MLPFARPEDFGVHDLTAAFAGIPINDPRYGPIVQPLRQLEAVVAIHKDLEEAQSAMDLASRTARPPEEPDEKGESALIVEALIVHALMLYCRAVHSSAKGRKQVDFKSKFSREERAAHELVTNLRDNVVAHHGPSTKHPGQSWLDDRVVVYRQPGPMGFSYPSIRPATKASVNAALLAAIAAATREAMAYGSEKQTLLSLALWDALANDPELVERLQAHPFNEEAFFGRPNPPKNGPNPHIVVPAGAPLTWKANPGSKDGE